MNDKKQFVIFPALIVAFTALRWPGLLPVELMGFSLVYAIVFCAGLYLRNWKAWAMLLVMLVVSDVVVTYGFHQGYSPPFSVMAMVYSLYFLTGLAGWLMRNQKRIPILVGGSMLAALGFYVVTNTVSWMGDVGYAKTFGGWFQALTLGKPTVYPPAWMFFRNTLGSAALFTAMIVGAAQWMAAREHAARVKRGELLGADA